MTTARSSFHFARTAGMLVAAVLAGTFAGTSGHATEPAQPAGSTEAAHAELMDAQGRNVGHVQIDDTPNGIIVRTRISGLSPGTHGFHIHETGKCEPPFKSAGGHFNPTDEDHGFADKAGWHVGDMPNLEIPSDKALEVTYFVSELDVEGGKAALLDDDGAAFIIHSQPDDYRTDPAGAAGDRIACGVVERGAMTGAERTAAR